MIQHKVSLRLCSVPDRGTGAPGPQKHRRMARASGARPDMGPVASEPLDPQTRGAQKLDSGHQGLCPSAFLNLFHTTSFFIFSFHIFGAPVVGKIFGAPDVSHDEAYLVQIGHRE